MACGQQVTYDISMRIEHRHYCSLRLQAWNLTGDVYSTHPGDKPWISEMYGYSFGAAKANVWHRYHTTAMIYPGYQPIGRLELAPLAPKSTASCGMSSRHANIT